MLKSSVYSLIFKLLRDQEELGLMGGGWPDLRVLLLKELLIEVRLWL